MYKYIDEKKEHLHTLDDKPLMGCSTVVGIIAKPLTWWASGLACSYLGWNNPKFMTLEQRISLVEPRFKQICSMTPEAYLKELDEAYKAHSVKLKDTAVSGTDLHAELEKYIKDCIETNNGEPCEKATEIEYLVDFSNWALVNVDKFIWSEAHCYSRELWTGGISDCGAKLKDGRTVIIDFKSSKESYQSQFVQIAGYAIMVKENGLLDHNGTKKDDIKTIDGYVVIPFGAKKFTADYRWNTQELEEGFRSAVKLYKINEQI